jgi:hypothetical protein
MDVCMKHQTQDSREDPCLYCLLEVVKVKTANSNRMRDIGQMQVLIDSLHQLAKNRLTLRALVSKDRSS